MNTRNKDRLYELLPYIYRKRDYEQGEPLRALLQVIAEQVEVIEQDIQQLYENWFIETCEDWVVPYIGDLIGYQPVHNAGEPGEILTPEGRLRNRILVPRREVANTLRYRRRKGTLALLEELANDVAGWPARAVEFYKLLGWTQSLNHQRTDRGHTADLRRGDGLDNLEGPFDEIAHSVDLRRIGSKYAQGRHNIPTVGVFVWRLKSYPVTHTQAHCLEKVGPHCYTFSVLGNDTPLYIRPAAEPDPTSIAKELNVPAPIRRRAFEERTLVDGHTVSRASQAYYGVLDDNPLMGNSLAIWVEGGLNEGSEGASLIPREKIIPADLSGWKYQPPRDHVAVDPVLGRIAFSPKHPPKKGVWVSYHYGFPADIGGGEYERPISQYEKSVIKRVSGQDELKMALELWQEKDGKAPDDQPVHGVIEVTESGVYVLPISICLAEGHSLQIRAAQRKRPVIRLLDWSERPDNLTVRGEGGSRFMLDGMMITGRGVQIEGELTSVTIRHSTLVPGWSLEPDCEPAQPSEPSIMLVNSKPCLLIEESIVGSIQVNLDEVKADPVRIRVTDSIIDATGADCDSPECEAIGAAGETYAHAALTIVRSTVIGRVQAHAVDLAENSIFMGRLSVARRQRGCMRFCYVTPGSRTPKRYRCQPDLAEDLAESEVRDKAENMGAVELPAAIKTARLQARDRVRPVFNSTRYGRPTYCQLADSCADEITHGADDESEMGVFHDLYQPQREANLRARLDEYTPAGMEAGIIYAS